MESPVYYNTTGLNFDELAAEIRGARRQMDAILAIYQAVKFAAPSRIEEICVGFGKSWPLHSIRRAITVLSDQNFLVKTEEKKIGRYGEKEHVWKLAEADPQLGLFEED